MHWRSMAVSWKSTGLGTYAGRNNRPKNMCVKRGKGETCRRAARPQGYLPWGREAACTELGVERNCETMQLPIRGGEGSGGGGGTNIQIIQATQDDCAAFVVSHSQVILRSTEDVSASMQQTERERSRPHFKEQCDPTYRRSCVVSRPQVKARPSQTVQRNLAPTEASTFADPLC